ncbi:Ankyrin repeat-containing domain protein [Penicillium vulpinum]|uniref:B30.2/SPRY domain-containing protein n=1 Tax=Penicillium vulpinum TaxID=29845 RepID=A0A1V6RVX6_9EURO|nr:Ankyrin repeat-containing domain protein [Penicillium vulpinum]KAJ5950794.1 Ankyrin repeat-containing domain protein [Penicillium vulpinum]OQE05927.1 hypothetical protein PENVUL_c021G02393 [Penicillium vulpinum]
MRAARFLSNEKLRSTWVTWYNELVEKKEDQIFETEEEQMPLQIAARFGLHGLVTHYASIIPTAEQAHSTLHDALNIAAMHGHEGIVGALLEHVTGISSHILTLSVKAGSSGAVRDIIGVGVDVNQADNEGCYGPLHYSVLVGSPEIATILLENHAKVDRKGPQGLTALHLAAMTGQVPMVELLLQFEASINLANDAGYDALKTAAHAGSSEIVRLLLDKGAQPSAVALDGKNALHVASEAGEPRITRMILDRAQDLFVCNAKGYTPVDLAAQRDNPAGLEEPLQRTSNTDNKLWFSKDDSLPFLASEALSGHRGTAKWFLHPPRVPGKREGSWAVYQAAAKGNTFTSTELPPRAEPETWPVIRDEQGQTALHEAIDNGYQAAVEQPLGISSFDINMKEDEEWTMVHRTAQSDDIAMTKSLINWEADINARDSEGKTPLHLAAQKGHLKVFQQLQSEMADLNAEDNYHNTPLSLAVEEGHKDVVLHILENENEKIAAREIEVYKGPLHVASLRGYHDLVQSFLEHGWSAHLRDARKNTPLHYAAEGDHLEVARTLLNADADINSTANYYSNLLFFTARSDSPNVLRALLEKGANINTQDNTGDTPSYGAACCGALKAVNTLLSWSPPPDLNLQNDDGRTALHAAYDSPEITQALLDAGTNPFIQTEDSKTPLALANFYGYKKTCDTLIKAMIPQALQNEALHMAAIHQISQFGKAQDLKSLLDGGFNCDTSDEDGTTALHFACLSVKDGTQAIEKVEMLVECGANLTKISSRWGTSLCAAAAGGNADIVQLLLSKGIGIEISNAQNQTPLMFAISNNQSDVADLLLRHKADPNHTNAKDGSALHVAVREGNLDTIKLLIGHGADPTIEVPKIPGVLLMAAGQKVRGIIEALVGTERSRVRLRDSIGRSLLMIAIIKRAEEVLDFLLGYESIELDAQDTNGKTALIIAAELWREAVPKLLSKKANPDLQDDGGKSALVYCILNKDLQNLSTLLRHQSTLTKLDARGRSPLYWACLTNNTEVFDIVLQAVKDSGSFECLAADAVRAAVAVKNSKFVETLLTDCNVNLNTPSPDGWSALFTAKQQDLSDIEFKLRSAGANDDDDLVDSSDISHIPSHLHPKDKHICLDVRSNGKMVIVVDGPLIADYENQSFGVVRADFPMSGKGIFYFEVTITKKSRKNVIGIGFCDEKAPLHRMLGWDSGSWGFHGDDGKIFAGYGKGRPYGKGDYSIGDTIGCCFDPNQGTTFYTRNGKSLGLAFRGVKGKLYPAICFDIRSPGSSVIVNFGDDESKPFVFGGPYELEHSESLLSIPQEFDTTNSASKMRQRRAQRRHFIME